MVDDEIAVGAQGCTVNGDEPVDVLRRGQDDDQTRGCPQPSAVDSTPVTSQSSSRTRTTDPGATSRFACTAPGTPS